MWFWWQILSLLNRMVMITAPRFFFNGWSCVENWGGGQMHVYGWRAWLKRSWKTRTRTRRRRRTTTTTSTMYMGGELVGLKGVGGSQTSISISFLLLRPSFWHQRVKLEPVWYSLIPWTISQSRLTWLWPFCSTFAKTETKSRTWIDLYDIISNRMSLLLNNKSTVYCALTKTKDLD